jgi:hypothetical protein
MLGFRFIDNYININRFTVVDEKIFTPNQESEIFFQLSDSVIRYIPITGAIVEVTFENIDSSHVVKRLATLVSVDDRSIYKISILPNEVIAAGSMIVKLTEVSSSRILPAFSTLIIAPTETSRFFL